MNFVTELLPITDQKKDGFDSIFHHNRLTNNNDQSQADKDKYRCS